MILPNDSQWKANYKAFLEYLAGHKAIAAANIEANRKEADRLKQEHEQYIERRRKENPYLYGRYLPNAKPLPLLSSSPIEQAPRRINIEALELETRVNKRKKQTVFSSEVSAA